MFPVQVLQDLGAAKAFETALHVIVEPFQRLGSQEPEENTELENRKFQLWNRMVEWWMAKSATIFCSSFRRNVAFYFFTPWIWAGQFALTIESNGSDAVWVLSLAASSLAALRSPATHRHVSKPKLAFGMIRDTWSNHPSCPSWYPPSPRQVSEVIDFQWTGNAWVTLDKTSRRTMYLSPSPKHADKCLPSEPLSDTSF